MKSKVVEKLEQVIKQHGATLRLYKNKEYLQISGGKCSGFYDSETNTLSVAGKRPHKEWLGILVHELAHLIQHKQNSKAWSNWEKICNFSYGIDDWLTSKKLNPSPKEVDMIYEATIELEREAEIIALKLISKYKIPLNKIDYIKSANCYLLFYHWSRSHRLWYKRAPYRIPKILNAMPDKLLTTKQLREQFHKFDLSECFLEKRKK